MLPTNQTTAAAIQATAITMPAPNVILTTLSDRIVGRALVPASGLSRPPLPKYKFRINTLKNLLIMKFGGTSMGSADRIRVAAEIIAEQQKQRPLAVVVSAMSKVTDLLLETLRREIPKSGKDALSLAEVGDEL